MTSLASIGKKRIVWAENNMPVLYEIWKKFEKQKPLKNIRISACLHVTTETANLVRVLKKGGADVCLCASNPLSTQDDVVESLIKDYGIPVFAKKGADKKTYYKHLRQCLEHKPQITMDDGADLVSLLHKEKVNWDIYGSTEETTTGVIRLKAMEKKGVLKFPVIAVNDSQTKYLFDNRYGTGQSTLDGILRATNYLLAGSTFVMCGYGWCGRGIAMRARGLGAEVIVTEVDPVKALEARMDGFEVAKLIDVVGRANVVVTSTGDINVVDSEHFKKMKDRCLVANSGHFDVEINLPSLKKMSKKVNKDIRPLVDEYIVGKKSIYILGEGRLVNLACAEGHPAVVMDMSFANQALAVDYLVENHKRLEKKVYVLPEQLDKNIANLKLKSMGISIDSLTAEQKKYLSSWQIGT